jgi:hypothetical protein
MFCARCGGARSGAGTGTTHLLPSPTPKQRQLRSRGTIERSELLPPTDDTHSTGPLDPPQCLVHAEHEILIFLYF